MSKLSKGILFCFLMVAGAAHSQVWDRPECSDAVVLEGLEREQAYLLLPDLFGDYDTDPILIHPYCPQQLLDLLDKRGAGLLLRAGYDPEELRARLEDILDGLTQEQTPNPDPQETGISDPILTMGIGRPLLGGGDPVVPPVGTSVTGGVSDPAGTDPAPRGFAPQGPRPGAPAEPPRCSADCSPVMPALDFTDLPLNPVPAREIDGPPEQYAVAERYFVRFDRTRVEVEAADVSRLLPTGVRVLRIMPGTLNAIAVSASPAQASMFEADPAVLGVSQDFRMTLASENPLLAALFPQGEPRPEDTREETRDVRVYVIDSGLRRDHVDISGKISGWIGVTAPLGGLYEPLCNNHGTMMGSLIAGRQTGVSRRAQLIDVTVLPCDANGPGEFYATDVLTALSMIEETEARQLSSGPGFVVNISLATHAEWALARNAREFDETAMVSAVRDFGEKTGAFIVSAAGNYGHDACLYFPAMVPDVISVGALDDRGHPAQFSNFGACVDIYAPGTGVPTATAQTRDSFALGTGTSQAAAVVTGIIAHRLATGEDPQAVRNAMSPKVEPRPEPDYLDALLTEAQQDPALTQKQLFSIASASPARKCRLASDRGDIAVRTLPREAAPIIATLEAGAAFVRLATAGAWEKLMLPGGQSGWALLTPDTVGSTRIDRDQTPCTTD